MNTTLRLAATLVVLAATGCEGDSKGKADAVRVTLSPDVLSSQEGSLHVRATVIEGGSLLRGWTVRLGISYTDRKGNLRTFAGNTGPTDRTGTFEQLFEGLYWEGSGTARDVRFCSGPMRCGSAGADCARGRSWRPS